MVVKIGTRRCLHWSSRCRVSMNERDVVGGVCTLLP